MLVTIPSTGLGVIADEQPQELPDGAWSSGLNVRFKDGYSQRISGHGVAPLTDPAAAAYHIARYNIGNNWIHCTLAGCFADTGAAQTDITGSAFTGAADDKFTSCILGGVFVVNNGKDLPQFWGGNTASNLAALTGWDANHKCKSMRAFKNYLIALNVTKTATNYASMVMWSDAAEPGTIPTVWTAAADNDAGEVDLAETPDSVVDALPLGDSLVIYKTSSMYAMQYIGGNDIWRFSRLPGTSGMLSQNCAVEIPSGHVVLTASDLVVHNGTGVQSIVDSKMRRWLFGTIDSTNFSRAFVTANHGKNEVWVCFPGSLATSCNKALIWNYKENTFTVRDLPNVTAGDMGPAPPTTTGDVWSDLTATSWTAMTNTWDRLDISNVDKRLLMSSTASKLYVMDDGATFAGTAFDATLERTGIAFGDSNRIKWVKGIRPRIDAAVGTVVSFQLGSTNDVEVGTTWHSTYTYTVGSTYKLDVSESGRFIGLRIIGSSSAWRLKSLDFEYVLQGDR